MKNSAWVKERISGLTIGIDRPSTTAPSRPPTADARSCVLADVAELGVADTGEPDEFGEVDPSLPDPGSSCEDQSAWRGATDSPSGLATSPM